MKPDNPENQKTNISNQTSGIHHHPYSLIIKKCKLYNSPNRVVDILIDNGVIRSIKEDIIENETLQILHADERIISPGFIDVHIQGAGGADILDGNEGSLQTMSKALAKIGTTGFLGTTVVKPTEDNRHLKLAREYVNKNLEGASLLGFHLEGPFINIKKKGGLDSASIYESSPEKLDEIFDITDNKLKMMTIAPELPGNLEIIRQLVKNGVVASFAHSEANYEETKKGFEAGINHVTHIFNAMRPLHHRNPGPLTAIFENKEVSAQIISDGHHLHPAIINFIYKILGKERCICITDGVQGMGLPEGNYIYNGKEYISKDGAARYLDGTLIGSTMSLGNIALKFMEFTGCSLETAINTITKNPAELLGIAKRKGSIKVGKDADLVLFEKDFSVYATLVGGQIVYRKD